MSARSPGISLEELRSAARAEAYEVLELRNPRDAVRRLQRLGMESETAWALGAGLWQIWARLDVALSGAAADPAGAAALARECAVELLEAIGDREQERAYCDRWIHERLADSRKGARS